MKRITLCFLFSLVLFMAKAQNSTITLSFSALMDGSAVALDSILIENQTQGGSMVIYDSEVSLTYNTSGVGTFQESKNELFISQNYPNPFSGKTSIDIWVPEKDFFSLDVYDLVGRKITSFSTDLNKGMHQFTFFACNQQNYILKVNSTKHLQGMLMVQIGGGTLSAARIEYNGASSQTKTSLYQPKAIPFQAKAPAQTTDTDFPFELGDMLSFTGYVGNQNAVIADAPSADAEYVFEFFTPTFILTLSSLPEEGGTASGAGSYPAGQVVTLTATPNEGYALVSWTDAEGTVVGDSVSFGFTMPAEDVTLTANFGVTYNLSVNVVPESSGTIEGAGDYLEGRIVTLIATPNQGYLFVNWTDAEGTELSDSTSFDFTMPAEDVTITANFVVSYNLTVNIVPESGGTVEGAGDYVEGTVVTLIATPSPGYYFVNWSDDEGTDLSDSTSFEVTIPAENIVLTANFAMPLYSVTVNIEPAESATIEGEGDYTAGSLVTLVATPSEGYAIASWTNEEGEVVSIQDSFDFVMPEQNVTLTASFGVSYSLTVNIQPLNGGTVEGAGNYVEGRVVPLKAIPDSGYYFLSWTNAEGSVISDTNSFDFTMPAEDVTLNARFLSVVFDVDSNMYYGIGIGSKEWLTENLRVTRYNNGDALPTGYSDGAWYNVTVGAYAVYPHGNIDGLNSPSEVIEAYGLLYNWFAVNDSRGICPTGWHVPSNYEWMELLNYVGGEVIAGGKLKSTRTEPDAHPRWNSPNTGATNEYGFSALPGGYRHNIDGFLSMRYEGRWWSSTESDGSRAFYMYTRYDGANADRGNFFKNGGLSIRCVKD